jgi:hypothetical protein
VSTQPGHGLDGAFAPGEVNLSNWQDPPWNMWGLAHTSEFVPTAAVARSPRTDDPPVTPLDCTDDATWLELTEATAARSVVVLSRGRVLGEWYGPGIRGQYLRVDPQAQVVVAKFGAHPDAVSAVALRDNAAFMRWLVRPTS